MPGRLVEQLVEAGLVTEAQARASDPGDPLLSPSRVIQNLVGQGLDERVLAGFFVSRGFGPMLQAAELERADHDLVQRLSPTDAHELCAMPLRPSPAGAIVAMGDPTDETAITKISKALGGSILPTVAKLSDLLASIDAAYPQDRPTLVSDPVSLQAPRVPSEAMPTRIEQRAQNAASPVRFDPAFSGLASTASPVWDRAWNRSSTEREVPLAAEPEPIQSTPVTPSRSSTSIASSVAVPPRTGSATEFPAAVSEVSIDTYLAELERVESRDEAVRVACQGCLSVARGAAFLALRKGVFRGWDGAGEDVTSASIRSLWVPASNPSILNDVLHSGRVFRGAYGDTAADHLFRAAFGSHGREVVIAPVVIGSRMVGVLCANDPKADTEVVERLAQAMAEAFQRQIVTRKSRAPENPGTS